MTYLLDTNILVRLTDTQSAHHEIANGVVRQLQPDHQLVVVPQNLIEFWNVVTRPAARNGLGLSPLNAEKSLQFIENTFVLFSYEPSVFTHWRRLVVQYHVSGVQVHDAHLVAAMLAHNVTHILTFNTRDFARYAPEGIVAVDPAALAETRP